MKIFSIILFILIFSFSTLAQTTDWMRVQSDNGEFSIEIPQKYNYLVDKDGFEQSELGFQKNYSLKNVKLFYAFADKTLLTFEIYEAKNDALKAIYNLDKERVNKAKKESNSEVVEKTLPNEIKELVVKNSEYFTARRYFNSKKNIYILTALSRNGENETMKRFFNSLLFSPDLNQTNSTNGNLLSSLKISNIEIVTQNIQPYIPNKTKTPDDPSVTKLLLVWKPRASYVDAARMRGVQGDIQVRCRFSQEGFISRIEFIKMLPEGLSKQTLFALLQIKFMPQEKDGKPISVDKLVEYHFSLY